jgi:hypothetical protein
VTSSSIAIVRSVPESIAIRIVLCFALLVTSEHSARAGVDLSESAKGLLGQLNPVNLALGPLVDDAVAKGNVAVAQRLEQLRATIQI